MFGQGMKPLGIPYGPLIILPPVRLYYVKRFWDMLPKLSKAETTAEVAEETYAHRRSKGS